MLTGFIIGLAIFVVAFIGVLVNMYSMSQTFDVDKGFKYHLIGIGMAAIGSLISLVCGAGVLVEKFAH